MSLEQSRVELALMSRNKRLFCRECDLSSQESIKKFADKFQKGLNFKYNPVTMINYTYFIRI